ncbi:MULTISPECIES: F0F1 ATP synthase subunit B [Streptomyces]|uniref:ATP synthase subunit b n=1 Tax=Streptomyces liliifuscus TaxID=2797636 RepID=A0A7T7I4L9_9ACTN|nr:F0F1 ATP synthase subunit B [Streptomyces liliifuscus]QQM40783.1 F0F1 ATP synthase subunit B [Streptomyces liliifuscus]
MIANLVQLAAEEEQNPLIPPGPELLVGTIAFAIVFFFFWKKLLPNINKVLEERRAAIEGGIEEADAMKVEAQSVLEQYKAQLAEARHEAARLRQEAQEQGATLIAEMRAEGQRQREEIIAAGHSQIAADRKAASSALRQDVGQLATELAGKLVGESLEDHARQSRTIDRFLDGLDESASKAEASR